MTSGGSKSTRGARQNPSASRTVTNLNTSRAERNSFDSRMDISPPPLHTYRKKKGVSPPDAPSKDVLGRRPQIRGRKSLPSIPNPNNQEKEIIDIDESEEDEDPKPNRPSSSGTSVSARRPSSVSRFLRNGDTSFNCNCVFRLLVYMPIYVFLIIAASTSKMHSNVFNYNLNGIPSILLLYHFANIFRVRIQKICRGHRWCRSNTQRSGSGKGEGTIRGSRGRSKCCPARA